MLKIKRIYEPSEKSDGFRVLVDRLWPRGVSKERAKLDLWAKEIAPSTALRKWFGHDPKRWKSFQGKYEKELRDNTLELKELRKLHRAHKNLTILYGAKDTEHNEAVVLARLL
jgi:uncharacterized protein YeaO (DUF488 family)